MFVVTNTIRVKTGFGEQLAARFKEPKGVQAFQGFIRLELLRTEGLTEFEEYKVCTTWDKKESFEAWTTSDSFKQAHAGRKGPSEHVLGNELNTYEVVVNHMPVTTVPAE
jgi:heme oxygenase (staphylobilin-producing)